MSDESSHLIRKAIVLADRPETLKGWLASLSESNWTLLESWLGRRAGLIDRAMLLCGRQPLYPTPEFRASHERFQAATLRFYSHNYALLRVAYEARGAPYGLDDEGMWIWLRGL